MKSGCLLHCKMSDRAGALRDFLTYWTPTLASGTLTWLPGRSGASMVVMSPAELALFRSSTHSQLPARKLMRVVFPESLAVSSALSSTDVGLGVICRHLASESVLKMHRIQWKFSQVHGSVAYRPLYSGMHILSLLLGVGLALKIIGQYTWAMRLSKASSPFTFPTMRWFWVHTSAPLMLSDTVSPFFE